jgi:hypothetical protein
MAVAAPPLAVDCTHHYGLNGRIRTRARLNHRKMTTPIAARHDPTGNLLCDIVSAWHRDAQQDNSTLGRQPPSPGQFAEVLIEGDQDALLAGGPRKHLGVAAARRRCPDPDDIISGYFQGSDRSAGNVLVSEETHFQAALG